MNCQCLSQVKYSQEGLVKSWSGIRGPCPIVEVSLAVVLSLLQKYEECDSLLTMYSVMKAEYWLIKLNTLPVWGSSFRIWSIISATMPKDGTNKSLAF